MSQTEPTDPTDQPGSPTGDAGGQRAPRVPAARLETPRARLLPGGDVDVVNISETGLLVEGKARPGVGTVVTIRIQGSRARLEGRIVRSRVSTIHRDGTLSYESAIEFDAPMSVDDIMNSRAGASTGTAESDPDVYVLDADNDW